jgi:hypothetical protein
MIRPLTTFAALAFTVAVFSAPHALGQDLGIPAGVLLLRSQVDEVGQGGQSCRGYVRDGIGRLA